MVQRDVADVGEMVGLRAALKPELHKTADSPKDMREWIAQARERYRGDTGLETLMHRTDGSLPARSLFSAGYWGQSVEIERSHASTS
jgi:hypothetical protein